MRKVVFGVLGISFFLLRLQLLPKLNLEDNQKVKVTGILSEEPQISNNRQQIKLGQFEAWVDRYPEFHYGNKIEIVGEIGSEKTATEEGIVYKIYNDYENYKIYNPEVKVLEEDKGNFIYKLTINLRIRLREAYNQLFPTPYDGIVAGVVLGDKTLIPKDFWEKLKITGTLHILVASGMNIALFSKGLLSFFCHFFKRRISVLLLILSIWFYSLLTGLQPPIIRAAIMATLLFIGDFFGRQTSGGRILWTTGLIMVFVNPLLIWDVGFQLSFLATAGLVYIQPILKNVGAGFIPARKGRADTRSAPTKIIQKYFIQNDNFTSSLSAQIATLPVLLLVFGQFNLLSPLINLLVLWSIPYILEIGAVIGILGLLGTVGFEIAKIASYPFILLLFFLQQIIELFAKVNVLRLQIAIIGWWWTIGYYVILGKWIRKKK